MGSKVVRVLQRPVQPRALGLRRWANTWGRGLALGVAFLTQIGLLGGVVLFLADWSPVFAAAQVLLGVVALLHILNTRMETTYKLAWAMPVLLLPILGTVFYLTFGTRRGTRWQRERMRQADDAARAAMRLAPSVDPESLSALPSLTARYLENTTGYLVHENTATTYYPLGEAGFEAMLEAIGRAKRCVFAEYYIVDEGEMIDRLLHAMAEKAAEGLDVRFLYDDMGCFFTLPDGFTQRCREAGIKVLPVNPIGLGFTLAFQNRDHRKILAIDGEVAFTGGINIADEYINLKQRYGHWKDTVVRLAGPGAWPFTVMFLHMWQLASGETVDYPAFAPPADAWADCSGEGLVGPFDDSPFDELSAGLDMYQLMLSKAQESVDIFSPYLIFGDGLLEQLQATARSGVRVRIVTPKETDQKYVHIVTRSYYPALLDAGVEIYEYTPGYIHAKSMIVDGEQAIVGTINFDFRSFYLHQECAVWVYRAPELLAGLRADVEDTVARSERIGPEALRMGPVRTVVQSVLRAFAPMM